MIDLIWHALELVGVSICEAPSFLTHDVQDHEYEAICK